MSQENQSNTGGFNVNRYLAGGVLLAALVVLALIGYLIVTTITRVQETPTVPEAFSTQVQQVVNPEPTIIASPQTIILQMQSLARLETASYSIEKVITAESGEGWLEFLFGDRMLLVAHGTVIAGVDLEKMGEDDVIINGPSVIMTIPAPEVLEVVPDNQNTYVYDRQTGVFGQNENLETRLRQEADKLILEAAIENGILDMAETNAELFFMKLLQSLGFEDVTIFFAAD